MLRSEKTKATLRTHRVPAPQPIEPSEIADIRNQLKASQAVFAAYLGVSKAAVVAWEYGQRKPSGAALRLLSIARRDPSVLLAA